MPETITSFHRAASTQAYLAQLPQEIQQRASDYTLGNHWLILFSALVGLIINLIVIKSGLLERIRTRWERRGARPWSASLIVFAVYYLMVWILDLPWAAYSKWWREVQYGLSNQSGLAWFSESLISACFSSLLIGIVVMFLYALMRRAPRTWWIWSSAVTSFIIVFAILIVPVAVEPLFNEFKPVPPGRKYDAIAALVKEAGIPPEQIVYYDGSKQSNNFTANVTGLIGTARVAVSDTLLEQASEAELRAVVAHEIAHFVKHHALWTALVYSGLLTLSFLITHLLYRALARRLHSPRSGELADPAGLPLLSLVVTLCFLLFTPLTNGIVRFVENEADIYSLDHAREPDGMAMALLRTADYRAPDPGVLEEWLFYDHPSIARRIQRAIDWKARQGL